MEHFSQSTKMKINKFMKKKKFFIIIFSVLRGGDSLYSLSTNNNLPPTAFLSILFFIIFHILIFKNKHFCLLYLIYVLQPHTKKNIEINRNKELGEVYSINADICMSFDQNLCFARELYTKL